MADDFESRVQLSSGCLMYVRTQHDDDRLVVFAFKHDEFRCDFQIFYDDCSDEFKSWVEQPVITAASF
jgi:hypothetical protein